MSRPKGASLRCTQKLAKYADAFGWNTDIYTRTGQQQRALSTFTPEFVFMLKRRLQMDARSAGLTAMALRKAFEAHTDANQSYHMSNQQLGEKLTSIRISTSQQDLDCIMLEICENPDSPVPELVVDWREFLRVFIPKRSLKPPSPAFLKLRARLLGIAARNPESLSDLVSQAGCSISTQAFSDLLASRVRMHVLPDELHDVCEDIKVEGSVDKVDVAPLVEGLDLIGLLSKKVAELAGKSGGAEGSKSFAQLFETGQDEKVTKKNLEIGLEKLNLTLTDDQKNLILEHFDEALENNTQLLEDPNPLKCLLRVSKDIISTPNVKLFVLSLEGVTYGSTFVTTVTDSQGGEVRAEGEILFEGYYDLPTLDVSSLQDGDLTVTVFVTEPSTNKSTTLTANVRKVTQAPRDYVVACGVSEAVFINRTLALALPLHVTISNSPALVSGQYKLVVTQNSNQIYETSGSYFSPSFDIPPFSVLEFPDGITSFSLVLEDSLGNIGEPYSMELSKDTTCPSGYVIQVKPVASEIVSRMRVVTQIEIELTNVEPGWEYVLEFASQDEPSKKIQTINGLVPEDSTSSSVTLTQSLDNLASPLTFSVSMGKQASHNFGEPVSCGFDPVLARHPATATVPFAVRHGTSLTIHGMCDTDGGEQITRFDITVSSPEALEQKKFEVSTTALEAAVSGGKYLYESQLEDAIFGGESDIVVQIRAVNGVGHADWSAETKITSEQVITLELAIGGLSKKRFGALPQLSLKQAVQSIMGSDRIFGASRVVLVSVTDTQSESLHDLPPATESVVIELELEPSCLFPANDNVSHVDALHVKCDELTQQLQQQPATSDVIWVRVVSKPKRVTYQRTGWLQIKVCRAVHLFKGRMEMEAHLGLQLGNAKKTTRNLAVFKEQEAITWDESHLFEHVDAKDQVMEISINSRKKLIETYKLDMVRDLFPGLTSIEIDTGCGKLELQCTYHPRSQAGREASKSKHTVQVKVE
eukprot:c11776_g1_i1.p1 GENE.c11776_g1_i1~~c11776_g1_i1.p1  ORF type:complete len:985 (-),score=294.97 c11776_g1_i1:358-3312(-)